MTTQLLSAQQAADQLGVHRKTVCDLIAAGQIVASNIGGRGTGKRWRIKQADLDRFIESRQYAA